MDDFQYDWAGSFILNDRKHYVPVLYSNSDRRKLDNNWFDNSWNAGNYFLLVRTSPY